MADPSPMGRYDVLQSYETRGPTLHESDDSVTLGQKNSDNTSTRTKITQVEVGRLGIIGTILSVTYGTWNAEPAACITLRFDFRCKDGQFRFESSEIGVSFTAFPRAQVRNRSTARSRMKIMNSPVVVFFYPQDHKLPSPTLSEKSSVGNDASRIQPLFSLKGRTWSKTTRDEPHQVFWTMHEHEAAKSGISDEVYLCTVVRHLGSFQATVEARAKLALGITLRNLPWSEDDPLLFDGVTGKGPQLETKEYDSLTVDNWTEWLSRFIRIGSSTSSICSVRGTAGAPQDAKTVRDEMAYRIRAIPKSWSERYFLEKLTALFQMGHRASDIILLSFAPSAFPLRHEQSAVISFSKGAPHVLSDDKQRWVLEVLEDPSADEASKVKLVFDRTFDGFTPLGRIGTYPGYPVSADIIVVPGLGGHAYGSFKERGGSYMWLQDSLAEDIQSMATTAGPIRVLTYGYESRVAESHSFQTLWDLGGKLQASIREIRQAKRPLVLIAHSLGGLVVKEAIIRMSMGDQKDQDNVRCIVGALFFGVPSKGMDTQSLIPMAGDQPNRPLLDSISTGSSLLQTQSQRFEKGFPFTDSSIISFHETKLSPTAVYDGSKWTMTGPPAVLVDPESATHGRSWETSSRFILGLSRNHSDLVKFSRSCDDYELVLGPMPRFN
ncbi:hypothetical protein S7711_02982 [Stachybotrys chartarum IBT 7711]|uniref:DUF676 domain-containing protein n=1 Tax=Stachybotrys chartarum (strain CBS 109288 / IBT 7711) TaxID=1280523 RepID=A0A084B2H9_STACB|nr:hypothetical protein S7711_02982 [Stachybotrys chartarum IBT 7711]KFA56002.1 hypothetical protein S40293_04049 [Stachybotrys chartarum IBT 40293]